MGTVCLLERITIEDNGLQDFLPCLGNVNHQGREMRSSYQLALSDPGEHPPFLVYGYSTFYVPQFVVHNLFL